MPPEAVETAPSEPCAFCFQLWAQKYASLTLVIDFEPYSSRQRQLRRCPKCGAYYLYRTDYEYLVNGWTEDEEDLTRLTDAEAAEYIEAGKKFNLTIHTDPKSLRDP